MKPMVSISISYISGLYSSAPKITQTQTDKSQGRSISSPIAEQDSVCVCMFC